MKLNWFSPLPPARTGIAQYTSDLLPELCAVAEVTAWTIQEPADVDLPKEFAVRQYAADRIPWAEFNRADMSIFQFGNNPAFHTDIWEISRRHSGIVILHDPSLHHFFDGLYRARLKDLNRYIQVMRQYYGEEGVDAAIRNYSANGRDNDQLAVRFPLTEHALENALGVLVHNTDTCSRLENALPIPTTYVPLPFRARQVPQSLASSGPPYRLVMFGYLGSNRRIDAVLTALHGMPEREMFSLDIYGASSRRMFSHQ